MDDADRYRWIRKAKEGDADAMAIWFAEFWPHAVRVCETRGVPACEEMRSLTYRLIYDQARAYDLDNPKHGHGATWAAFVKNQLTRRLVGRMRRGTRHYAGRETMEAAEYHADHPRDDHSAADVESAWREYWRDLAELERGELFAYAANRRNTRGQMTLFDVEGDAITAQDELLYHDGVAAMRVILRGGSWSDVRDAIGLCGDGAALLKYHLGEALSGGAAY